MSNIVVLTVFLDRVSHSMHRNRNKKQETRKLKTYTIPAVRGILPGDTVALQQAIAQ